MKEADFTADLMDSLRAHGAYCYKIADSPASWTAGITRFTPDKPCDVVTCFKGQFIAIECKQIKKFQAFGRTQIRQSQMDAADAICAAGGLAYIFLNIRIKAVKGVSKPENRLLIFEWREWSKTFKAGTIKQKDLMSWSHTTGTKGIYDLDKFIGGL